MRSLFRRSSIGGKKADNYKTEDEQRQAAVSLEDAQFEFLPGITPRSPDQFVTPPDALVNLNSAASTSQSNIPAPPRPLENPPLTFLNTRRKQQQQQQRDFSNINHSPRVPTLSTLKEKRRTSETESVFSFQGEEGGGGGEHGDSNARSRDASRSRGAGIVSTNDDSRDQQPASRRGRRETSVNNRGREDSVMSRREDSVSRRIAKSGGGLIKRIFSAKGGRRKDNVDAVTKVVETSTTTEGGEQSSARSHELSARSGRSNLTDEDDQEAVLQYAQYMLSGENGASGSGGPSNGKLCSKAYAEDELKRVPEVSWLVKCAMQAPLPPFWSLHTSKGADATPYYANSQTQESSWTHPSDPTFKSLIQILQRGVDIRGQLKTMYASVLNLAEKLSTQWQGPYYERDKAYYHHLQTGRSVWGDPFQNAHYIAEICVKLLGFFGSRSDILEAAGGFSKRKEALRQARSRLEKEMGPLDAQELAYLYQGTQLPGAVMDAASGGGQQHPGAPHAGGMNMNHAGAAAPGMNVANHPHQMHHPHMAAGAGAQPMMYNPGVPIPQGGYAAPMQPQVYLPGAAAPYPGGYQMPPGGVNVMQVQPGLQVQPGMQMQVPQQGYNPYGVGGGQLQQPLQNPPQPGALLPQPGMYGQPQHQPSHNGIPQQHYGGSSGSSYHHPEPSSSQHYGDGSRGRGREQYHDPSASGGGSAGNHNLEQHQQHQREASASKGTEWFNNDRNLVRCNSRSKRRERSRSKSKEPELRKLVRVNSRDSLPKDMRLPDPFQHGYAGPVGGGGAGANANEAEHYVRTNASITGGRGPSPGPQRRPSQTLDDVMRQSREYADRQLGGGQKGNTPQSDGKTLTYSDDSDQEGGGGKRGKLLS